MNYIIPLISLLEMTLHVGRTYCWLTGVKETEVESSVGAVLGQWEEYCDDRNGLCLVYINVNIWWWHCPTALQAVNLGGHCTNGTVLFLTTVHESTVVSKSNIKFNFLKSIKRRRRQVEFMLFNSPAYLASTKNSYL